MKVLAACYHGGLYKNLIGYLEEWVLFHSLEGIANLVPQLFVENQPKLPETVLTVVLSNTRRK